MNNNLLTDNFLLQEIALLFTRGLSNGQYSEIEILKDKNTHIWNPVQESIIQLESLLNFLTDIVIRDSLIVDERYINAWHEYTSEFDKLIEDNIISIEDIDTRNDSFFKLRNYILSELCVTDSMRTVQMKNEETWTESHKAYDSNASIVIWGTAGNLCRSDIVNAPYAPHPLRKRVIAQSNFSNRKMSAANAIIDFIDQERDFIIQEQRGNLDFRSLQLVLPPIAVEIIESSGSINNLIPTAIQLRKKYANLRNFINQYQDAINCEDTKNLLKYKKELSSLHQKIHDMNRSNNYSSASVSIGVGFVNLQLPLPRINLSKNRIKSTLQDIIFEKRGEESLKKLIKMFDEKGTIMEQEIIHRFVRK